MMADVEEMRVEAKMAMEVVVKRMVMFEGCWDLIL